MDARTEELVALCLNNEITEEQAAELLAILETDAESMTLAADLWEVHNDLAGMHEPEVPAEKLQRDLKYRIKAESSSVARRVNAQVKKRALAETRQRDAANKTPFSLNPPKGRRWISGAMWIASAACIVVALSVYWHYSGHQATPGLPGVVAEESKLVVESGRVQITRKDQTIAASVGEPIQIGDGLAAAGAPATVKYSDGTIIILKQDSRAERLLEDSGKAFRLIDGAAYFIVAKQDTTRPMVIHTKDAKVKVVGTELEVKTGTARTIVQVESGKVQVVGGAATVALEANQRCAIDSGKAPTAAASITAAAIARWRHPDNLLTNGGFEDDKRGWDIRVFNPKLAVSIGTDKKHSGSKSLRVQLSEIGHAVKLGEDRAYISQRFKFQPRAEYNFTIWNISGKTTVRARASWSNDKGEVVDEVDIGESSGSNEWTAMTSRIKVPAGATHADIRITVSPPKSQQQAEFCWIDDCFVSIEEDETN